MSSQTMVIAFVSLTAVCQMAFCAESVRTKKIEKGSAGHHNIAIGTPIQGKKHVHPEPRSESRAVGAMAPGVSGRDGNEQFTRMSCCP